MDSRSTVAPSPYPHQRRALVQKATAQATPADRKSHRLGSPTAGLDQSVVGAVNASRIAALKGKSPLSKADPPPQGDDDAATGYRQTQVATTPAPTARLAS